MKKLIMLMIMALSVAGCSTLGVATGYVVSEYCETPIPARLVVRESVNVAAAPHKVRIDCDGDQAFFTPSSTGSDIAK